MKTYIAWRLYYLGNWFMDSTPFWKVGAWIKDRRIVDEVYKEILHG